MRRHRQFSLQKLAVSFIRLFLQLKAVFECFSDPLGDFVIAVGVGIKGNGVHQGHIDAIAVHDFFMGVSGYYYNGCKRKNKYYLL